MSDWIPPPEYDDFFGRFGGIENPLALEVRVDPALNDGANILATFTGTVKIDGLYRGAERYEGQSAGAWSRGTFKFEIPTPGRTWYGWAPGYPMDDPSLTYVLRTTVTLSLASIFNKNVANNAGWAVDGANAYGMAHEVSGLAVDAAIAVRDSDGYLYRLAYQVTALGRGPVPPREVKG